MDALSFAATIEDSHTPSHSSNPQTPNESPSGSRTHLPSPLAQTFTLNPTGAPSREPATPPWSSGSGFPPLEVLLRDLHEKAPYPFDDSVFLYVFLCLIRARMGGGEDGRGVNLLLRIELDEDADEDERRAAVGRVSKEVHWVCTYLFHEVVRTATCTTRTTPTDFIRSLLFDCDTPIPTTPTNPVVANKRRVTRKRRSNSIQTLEQSLMNAKSTPKPAPTPKLGLVEESGGISSQKRSLSLPSVRSGDGRKANRDPEATLVLSGSIQLPRGEKDVKYGSLPRSSTLPASRALAEKATLTRAPSYSSGGRVSPASTRTHMSRSKSLKDPGGTVLENEELVSSPESESDLESHHDRFFSAQSSYHALKGMGLPTPNGTASRASYRLSKMSGIDQNPRSRSMSTARKRTSLNDSTPKATSNGILPTYAESSQSSLALDQFHQRNRTTPFTDTGSLASRKSLASLRFAPDTKAMQESRQSTITPAKGKEKANYDTVSSIMPPPSVRKGPGIKGDDIAGTSDQGRHSSHAIPVLPQILILKHLERARPSVQSTFLSILREHRIRVDEQESAKSKSKGTSNAQFDRARSRQQDVGLGIGMEEGWHGGDRELPQGVYNLPRGFVVIAVTCVHRNASYAPGLEPWDGISRYLLERFSLSRAFYQRDLDAFSPELPPLSHPLSMPLLPFVESAALEEVAGMAGTVNVSPLTRLFIANISSAVRHHPGLETSMMTVRAGYPAIEDWIRIWVTLTSGIQAAFTVRAEHPGNGHPVAERDYAPVRQEPAKVRKAYAEPSDARDVLAAFIGHRVRLRAPSEYRANFWDEGYASREGLEGDEVDDEAGGKRSRMSLEIMEGILSGILESV